MKQFIQSQLSKLLLTFLVVSGELLANTAVADPKERDLFNNTRFEGFFSQTASYSSEHNFLSQSERNLSFDFWEAGVLASTDIIGDLKFSSQVLGREVSHETGMDFRIDYAFIAYPVVQNPSFRLDTRLGRIRSSFGFYNDTRDIAHTRTGIVMPQSIYYDMTRNSFYSSDGIEFVFQTELAGDHLTFQVLASKPVEEDEELKEASSLNPNNFDGDKGLLAKISYGSEFEGWRAAFTYYRPEYTVDASFLVADSADQALGQLLPGVTLDASGSSFYSETMLTSIEYNAMDWAITAEYSRHKFRAPLNIDVSSDLQNQFVPDPQNGGQNESAFVVAQNNLSSSAFASLINFNELVGYEENVYLQGLYRFDERWEGYIRYDFSQPHTGRHLATNERWKDANFGGSFRPNHNWVLKAEAHYIEGTTRLLSRDNPGHSQLDQYWTAFFFQVAYRW